MNYIVVALSVSVITNIFLLWFCYKLFQNMLTLSDSLYQILEQVKDFAFHLDSVYNTPVFFGDETLGALLSHSKDLTGDMDDFIKAHAFDLEIEAEEGVEEQDEEAEIDQKAA